MSSLSEAAAAPLIHELVDCFSQQISELDLLKSMYSNHGDITIAEKGILDEIDKFINGNSEYVPNNLDFQINLVIENQKLEFCVNLPVTYPNDKPNVFIRCNQLNRQQESQLNTELFDFINQNHDGEVCLYTAIAWLQDNMVTLSKPGNVEPVNQSTNKNKCDEERFSRLWIYSHHIFSKKKREEIAKKANELKLTGFCLVGKPGIICIEGNENASKEWWQDIKTMNWKKIMIRKIETFEHNKKSSNQRFFNFEEHYTDMREFSKFMSALGFSEIFNKLFGFNE